MYKIITRS